MKKNRLLLIAALMVVAVAGSFIFLPTTKSAPDAFAMTELQVKNISCGSCVENIRNALDELDGIQSVDVSLTSGRSRVVYDSTTLKAAQIARAVSAAGYPATVLRQLSAEQYRNLQAEDAHLAKIYVAKVGEMLLGREDFEQAVRLQQSASGSQNRPAPRAQVLQLAWQGLLQRTLMLADAERHQVVVQNGEVDLRIQRLREQQPGFDKTVRARFGSLELFARQLKEDMTINRNIEEHVLAGAKKANQRQTLLRSWYQQLVDTTPVLIYDPGLKQATEVGSGCSSGCCSRS